MLIVIDLSKKLVGFNLFESFLYPLKNDGTLVFLNNQIGFNDNIDYNKLKSDIHNILYEHHVNYFNLCVLFDMKTQKEDPLKYSITSNIHNIKENIIKPLSCEYRFDKLFYLLLDDIQRNDDYLPYDKNIRMSIDFDSKGYVSDIFDNKYSKLVFNDSEIGIINDIWLELADNYLNCDVNNIDFKNNIVNKFKSELNTFFEPKINLINNYYLPLSWYADKLNKIYNNLIIKFENNIYKDFYQEPSDILKSLLNNEVSSYNDNLSIIIHIDFNDNNYSYNSEVSNYFHQLEIIGLIIYLATNDTKYIFENNTIGQENHWKISTIINNNNLYKLLSSYNLKLKIELSKLGKFANSEIEYREFAPRTFNYSMCMTKPDVPSIPCYSILPNKNDVKRIEVFKDKLYDRYLTSIDYANKRLLDITTKFRIQKEADALGKNKKVSFTEMNDKILKMQEEIKILQKKIAFYSPKENIIENPDIKANYDIMVNEILILMSKRINIYSFLKNILLIILISFCTSSFIKLVTFDDVIKNLLLIFTFVIPLGAYIMLQIRNSISLMNKINMATLELAKYGEYTVNELFSNDYETLEYVQNIYNLIMLKKYYNECNLKVIEYNRNFEYYMYHYNKLKEHIEVCDKLIDILNIKSPTTEFSKIENIKSLDIEKNLENNPLYSPLYYLLDEEIENKIVVNNQKNIELNSRILAFIDKFVITYDKEYDHD